MENILKKIMVMSNDPYHQNQIPKLLNIDGWQIVSQDENGVVLVHYKKWDYDFVVEKLIKQKYSIEQELAIQRQRDTKPEQFKEYFDYVELCKVEAKKMIDERDGKK